MARAPAPRAAGQARRLERPAAPRVASGTLAVTRAPEWAGRLQALWPSATLLAGSPPPRRPDRDRSGGRSRRRVRRLTGRPERIPSVPDRAARRRPATRPGPEAETADPVGIPTGPARGCFAPRAGRRRGPRGAGGPASGSPSTPPRSARCRWMISACSLACPCSARPAGRTRVGPRGPPPSLPAGSLGRVASWPRSARPTA